jgi:hypothetical protein
MARAIQSSSVIMKPPPNIVQDSLACPAKNMERSPIAAWRAAILPLLVTIAPCAGKASWRTADDKIKLPCINDSSLQGNTNKRGSSACLYDKTPVCHYGKTVFRLSTHQRKRSETVKNHFRAQKSLGFHISSPIQTITVGSGMTPDQQLLEGFLPKRSRALPPVGTFTPP